MTDFITGGILPVVLLALVLIRARDLFMDLAS